MFMILDQKVDEDEGTNDEEQNNVPIDNEEVKQEITGIILQHVIIKVYKYSYCNCSVYYHQFKP